MFLFEIFQTDGNKAHGALRENMAPILKVITMLALTHRNFRKYLRLQILPPIRDVSTRPEVNRNCLHYIDCQK